MRVAEVGEYVKWMLPLENEYSYGEILDLQGSTARVKQIGGYHHGMEILVHLRYMTKGGARRNGSKAT